MALADQTTGVDASFPPTHWSVVLRAGEAEPEKAAEALEKLCRAYWYPLYAFARRAGRAPADAQDLTQGFFAYLLESHLVAKAEADKGRFRSFLLASMKHFMTHERVREHAQKRSSDCGIVPLSADEAEVRFEREPAIGLNPEVIYERNWALAVLDQALHLMQGEFEQSGRAQLFERLHPFLEGDPDGGSYAEAAQGLGTTEGTIKVTVNRMRQRYRELLRSVVAHTVASLTEVEEELRHLVAVLRG